MVVDTIISYVKDERAIKYPRIPPKCKYIENMPKSAVERKLSILMKLVYYGCILYCMMLGVYNN